MQPDCPTGRSELGCILQKIRKHALHFRRIKRELRKLVVGQEVKCKTFFLESVRPQATDLGDTAVHVPHFKLHAQFAGFQNAVG